MRVPLTSFRTINASEITETAQLDRRTYTLGQPIYVRFRVTNRTRDVFGVFDNPRAFAKLLIRDSSGRAAPYRPQLIVPPAYTHIPALRLNPGATITTKWFALNEWGFAPTAKGTYSVTVVPSIRPTNIVIRPQANGATAVMGSGNLIFFIV